MRALIAFFSAFGHGVRLSKIGFMLAREGAFNTVEAHGLPALARFALWCANLISKKSAGKDDNGDAFANLLTAIARLGPSYVKLGQFLATRPDVVGFRLARALEALQDKMAPFSEGQAHATIQAAFGRSVHEVYAQLSPALAAASIAQVHRALVLDIDPESGEKQERWVAVKIIRPFVRQKFAQDLSDMYFIARLAERFFAEARRLRAVEVVDVLARSVTIEMDFRLEAAACAEFAENCRDDLDFRVPEVDWDRTARDVLTLSWIDAVPLSDMARLKAAGVNLKALGATVITAFLRHALRDGFFHADMHPGNLFVDDTGCLIAVDFGIMGRLGARERRFLAEILFGFITRNYRRVAEVHFEAGYVPKHHRVEDFAQAIRAIGEPIYAQTADKISMAKLLTLLFEVTALFDMQTRLELVMLQKTMVVAEGVARALDPKLDMWRTAEPVVRAYITRELGAKGRLAEGARDLKQLAEGVRALPALVEDVRARLEADETGRRQGVRADVGLSVQSWVALALWVLVALLAFGKR